jgi:YggT family protein
MAIIAELLQLYTFVIVLRAISSFFPIGPDSPFLPIVRILYQLTEPIFAPIRRVLPAMGGLDFTPLVVLIGIQIISNILLR